MSLSQCTKQVHSAVHIEKLVTEKATVWKDVGLTTSATPESDPSTVPSILEIYAVSVTTPSDNHDMWWPLKS